MNVVYKLLSHISYSITVPVCNRLGGYGLQADIVSGHDRCTCFRIAWVLRYHISAEKPLAFSRCVLTSTSGSKYIINRDECRY